MAWKIMVGPALQALAREKEGERKTDAPSCMGEAHLVLFGKCRPCARGELEKWGKTENVVGPTMCRNWLATRGIPGLMDQQLGWMA